MNRSFPIKHMCSHSLCSDPLMLLEFFFKVIRQNAVKHYIFKGFSLLMYNVQWPVSHIGQIGANGLILVGYDTAVTKDTVIYIYSWLVVFNVPSTARSFRDGTPFTVPSEGCEVQF